MLVSVDQHLYLGGQVDILRFTIDALVVMSAYANLLVSAVLLITCLAVNGKLTSTAILQVACTLPLVARVLGWW